MDKQSLISIIVPVYNREKYLRDCIESIINQTYRNLEIILVNDGSTDGSLNICLEYAEKDYRIKIIDQENSGPSAARNTGIEAAKGEYVGFVDSDDTIEPQMYEVLLNNIKLTNSDVSIIGMQFVYNDNQKKPYVNNMVKRIFEKDDIRKVFWDNLTITFAPVDKLFSRSVIADILFDTSIKMCEDQKFVYEVLKNAEKVIYEPTIYYNINYSDNSLSRATPTRYHLSMLDVTEYILNEITDIEEREKALLYHVNMCLNFFVVHYKNGQFTKEDIARVDQIIYNNVNLVMRRGKFSTKIKLLIYLISPMLLRKFLLIKQGIE